MTDHQHTAALERDTPGINGVPPVDNGQLWDTLARTTPKRKWRINESGAGNHAASKQHIDGHANGDGQSHKAALSKAHNSGGGQLNGFSQRNGYHHCDQGRGEAPSSLGGLAARMKLPAGQHQRSIEEVHNSPKRPRPTTSSSAPSSLLSTSKCRPSWLNRWTMRAAAAYEQPEADPTAVPSSREAEWHAVRLRTAEGSAEETAEKTAAGQAVAERRDGAVVPPPPEHTVLLREAESSVKETAAECAADRNVAGECEEDVAMKSTKEEVALAFEGEEPKVSPPPPEEERKLERVLAPKSPPPMNHEAESGGADASKGPIKFKTTPPIDELDNNEHANSKPAEKKRQRRSRTQSTSRQRPTAAISDEVLHQKGNASARVERADAGSVEQYEDAAAAASFAHCRRDMHVSVTRAMTGAKVVRTAKGETLAARRRLAVDKAAKDAVLMAVKLAVLQLAELTPVSASDDQEGSAAATVGAGTEQRRAASRGVSVEPKSDANTATEKATRKRKAAADRRGDRAAQRTAEGDEESQNTLDKAAAQGCAQASGAIAPKEDGELSLPENPSGCARAEPLGAVQRRFRELSFSGDFDEVVGMSRLPTASEHEQRVGVRGVRRGMEVSGGGRHRRGGGGGAAASGAADGEHRPKLTKLALKTRKKRLDFVKSGIHGWGLVARESIDSGEYITEYIGEVVRQSVADERELRYQREGMDDSYLFRIDSTWIVDATRMGALARFVNHSCDPNVVARIVEVELEKKIVFYSRRAIAAGEELTYNYQFEIEDDKEKLPCHCGAALCRKTLN